jgi:hypothetical protein
MDFYLALMLKLHSFEVSGVWGAGMPKFLKKLLYLVPQEAPPDNGAPGKRRRRSFIEYRH